MGTNKRSGPSNGGRHRSARYFHCLRVELYRREKNDKWRSVVDSTWEELRDGLPTGLTDVIVDPSDSRIVYVSTENAGVYKSNDRGQHFTVFNEGLPVTRVNSLVIDSTGTFLAAATDLGVFTISPGDGPLPPIIRRRCGNKCAH